MSTGLVVLLGALVVVAVVALLRRRGGRVRTTTDAPGVPVAPDGLAEELAGLVPDGDGPVVLHFSASWCGPCAGVRRVVDQVAAELGGVRHAEVDLPTHPDLAARFRVLSLPTVLVLDEGLATRARVSGVPAAAELRRALVPLVRGPG